MLPVSARISKGMWSINQPDKHPVLEAAVPYLVIESASQE
jgi:hypothetical protein